MPWNGFVTWEMCGEKYAMSSEVISLSHFWSVSIAKLKCDTDISHSLKCTMENQIAETKRSGKDNTCYGNNS